MDIRLLMAERRRVANAFRAKLSDVAMLRAQVADAHTDEARQRLYGAVDEAVAACRDLGDKLLQLDARVLEMQTREAAVRSSPLVSAPLDF